MFAILGFFGLVASFFTQVHHASEPTVAEEGRVETREPAFTCFCLEVIHTIFVYMPLAHVSHDRLEEGGKGKKWRYGQALVVSTIGSLKPLKLLGREWVRVLSMLRRERNGKYIQLRTPIQVGGEGSHMHIDPSSSFSLKCEDDNFSITWTSHVAVA